MREYKMRRGEYLDERVEDMATKVEEFFGPVRDTETYKGSDLLVVEDPNNAVFSRVTVGTVEYSGKKNKLALDIEERPAGATANIENTLTLPEREAGGERVVLVSFYGPRWRGQHS